MPFVKRAEVTAQQINKDVLCSPAGHVESAKLTPVTWPAEQTFLFYFQSETGKVAQGEGAGSAAKQGVRRGWVFEGG